MINSDNKLNLAHKKKLPLTFEYQTMLFGIKYKCNHVSGQTMLFGTKWKNATTLLPNMLFGTKWNCNNYRKYSKNIILMLVYLLNTISIIV